MKKTILFILLFCHILHAQQITGKVIKIKDGDTIAILSKTKEEITIRLNGIDAPEKSQVYGKRSREILSNLIYGKTVTVIGQGYDRYERLLGDIYLEGKNINYEMVRSGYAWMYRRYSNDKNLDKLELEAKRAKRGLWADPKPIPPWSYRRK